MLTKSIDPSFENGVIEMIKTPFECSLIKHGFFIPIDF
jgi:hypothetical protein